MSSKGLSHGRMLYQINDFHISIASPFSFFLFGEAFFISASDFVLQNEFILIEGFTLDIPFA